MARGKVLILGVGLMLAGAMLLAGPAGTFNGNGKGNGNGGGGGPDDGPGRLSPASLDIDTCGCPTTFGDPTCEDRTYWSLDKTTDTGDLVNPDGEAFLFDVTVTEGPTATILSGSGQIVITNSGDQTPSLSSVAVLLEDLTPGQGDAPGPSGNNWTVLGVTAENEAAACGASSVSCGGTFDQTPGANLVLYDCDDKNDIIALSESIQIPPTVDNDGDGFRDEDPVYTGANDTANSCDFIDNDGDGSYDEDPVDMIDNDLDGLYDEDGPDDDWDGLVDEDGACEDAVVMCFDYEFDITDLDIESPGDLVVPSADDLRIDLLVTFKAGGKRGGTCKLDVDCDGVVEDGKGGNPDEGEGHVRTVQQRHRFDPPDCLELCECVALEDLGAEAQDDCIDVTTDTLDEDICSAGEGTVTARDINGTVSCQNCEEVADLNGLEDALDPYNPGGDTTGTANLNVAYPGGDSYFNSTVSNGGDFNGTYDGWCIDVNTTISPGTTYCTELISSYDPFADNLVNVPYLGTGERTLDLVNWIINQDYTTQAATCVARNYTFGDIQRAIWDLVNPTSTSGLGTWSQCAADEIRNAALADYAANGAFVPACGQDVAVIFNPCGNTGPDPAPGYQITIYQITVGSTAVPCETVCDECWTVVENTATLTCEDDQDLVAGSPASAAFEVHCEGGGEPGIGPGDFCSQTQGGWGTDNCNGNNTACLRDMYFAGLFPSGLVVGDPDGPDADTSYSILLTSSAAVAQYLPAGGPPAALTADQTDPQMTSSGVFGGQLVAATLNVAFDAAGVGKCTLTGDCDFGYAPGTLGTLVYTCGADDDLIGLSVNAVIALANIAISGGGTPAGVTISDLNDALSILNEEYVDCDTVATGCLQLP